MTVAVHAADSAIPAMVPNGRVERTSQDPARGAGCSRSGLSERALEPARRAAAQAPPLRPGTVERVRQIIFGASPAPAERKAG